MKIETFVAVGAVERSRVVVALWHSTSKHGISMILAEAGSVERVRPGQVHRKVRQTYKLYSCRNSH